jgi:pimeloyl-ACP methyl ester carboxylesterase
LGRRISLIIVVLAGWAGTAHATPVTLTMDDGVKIACDFRPAPAPPAPAVMLFHGIGGKHEDLDPIAAAINAAGFATLACDARGQGASGGLFDLDGPRTVEDIRTQFSWLGSQFGVDGAHIGAWGISLGGGAALNSAVAGVPWGAIETVETWSDLLSALAPNRLAKSGAIALFANDVPESARTDEFKSVLQAALTGTSPALVEKYAAPRSSLSRLGSVSIPTFLFQGREDYAFDIAQMTGAFAALKGPKRLYVGDFGHAPSTFPGPDVVYVVDQGIKWFDRWLKGTDAKVQPAVGLAPNPWTGTPWVNEILPPTRTLKVTLRGSKRIGSGGKVVRTARLPAGRLETFGAPVVRVRLAGTFTHVVAVLQAGSTIVSEGGAATPAIGRARWVRIPLISTAVRLPSRARLKLTIAATSTAQNPQNLLYLIGVPSGKRLTVGTAKITLPLLKHPVSR